MNQTYALITAARNERDFIEDLAKTVLSQTNRPRRWVVVSDASTDGTDDLLRELADRHDFLVYLRSDSQRQRDFTSKVNAIRQGAASLGASAFDFIGNLDADVSLEATYYDSLLAKFAENPKLGLAGGVVLEVEDGKPRQRFGDFAKEVAGAAQVFRRECWTQIEGYRPMRFGGEDALAAVMARMEGWDVRAFPDLRILHRRKTGTAEQGLLKARFLQGREDYSLGALPRFFWAKCAYRTAERPYVVGSLFRLLGFTWSALVREERPIPPQVMEYTRAIQARRLSSSWGPDSRDG